MPACCLGCGGGWGKGLRAVRPLLPLTLMPHAHLRCLQLHHTTPLSLNTHTHTTPPHRAGSGRDLSWHSWDCWYVIISNLYGPPKQDTKLIPLAGEPPVDYTPPPGQFAQPGAAVVSCTLHSAFTCLSASIVRQRLCSSTGWACCWDSDPSDRGEGFCPNHHAQHHCLSHSTQQHVALTPLPPLFMLRAADYRSMVCQYEAATEARKAAAAARLRQGYRAEAQQREAVQVKVGQRGGTQGGKHYLQQLAIWKPAEGFACRKVAGGRWDELD